MFMSENNKVELIKLENEYKIRELYPDIKSLQRELILIQDKILKLNENTISDYVKEIVPFIAILLTIVGMITNDQQIKTNFCTYICYVIIFSIFYFIYMGIIKNAKCRENRDYNMRKSIIENEIKEREKEELKNINT